MAIFKCKMCGADLEIVEDSKVCECEYCGSTQTIPSLDNEKKVNLFTRANRLRMACEFDKAAGVYESIVSEFQDEAEAYWGLILCKYGIEYVDDPKTGKKIPTCHRSSFDSVMEDSNFEMVMECGDIQSRLVYREEAKTIEKLRTDIIEVSSKEEPYDIFICYKETDEKGDRTIDSVIAQDVYDALIERGYKVFFSRITLEDKLGQEYEPYIFAALNSAKVMLVFGTNYEYYNAVWVKNEWSRFLSLIEKGEKKTIIPCYKDIDAYDMPNEFKRLQAQDMGKVGAIQDLIRGIEKIIGKKQIPTNGPIMQTNTVEMNETLSLLKRVELYLEDHDWDKAINYCERILDGNAECSLAYLYKEFAEKKVGSIDELIFEYISNNYTVGKSLQYAKRFSDVTTKDYIDKFDKCLSSKDDYIFESALKFVVTNEWKKIKKLVSVLDSENELFIVFNELSELKCNAKEYLDRYFENDKRISTKVVIAITNLFGDDNDINDFLWNKEIHVLNKIKVFLENKEWQKASDLASKICEVDAEFGDASVYYECAKNETSDIDILVEKIIEEKIDFGKYSDLEEKKNVKIPEILKKLNEKIEYLYEEVETNIQLDKLRDAYSLCEKILKFDSKNRKAMEYIEKIVSLYPFDERRFESDAIKTSYCIVAGYLLFVTEDFELKVLDLDNGGILANNEFGDLCNVNFSLIGKVAKVYFDEYYQLIYILKKNGTIKCIIWDDDVSNTDIRDEIIEGVKNFKGITDIIISKDDRYRIYGIDYQGNILFTESSVDDEFEIKKAKELYKWKNISDFLYVPGRFVGIGKDNEIQATEFDAEEAKYDDIVKDKWNEIEQAYDNINQMIYYDGWLVVLSKNGIIDVNPLYVDESTVIPEKIKEITQWFAITRIYALDNYIVGLTCDGNIQISDRLKDTGYNDENHYIFEDFDDIITLYFKDDYCAVITRNGDLKFTGLVSSYSWYKLDINIFNDIVFAKNRAETFVAEIEYEANNIVEIDEEAIKEEYNVYLNNLKSAKENELSIEISEIESKFDNERIMLQNKWNEETNTINTKRNELSTRKMTLYADKAKLGIFKAKEKASIDYEINTIEQTLRELRSIDELNDFYKKEMSMLMSRLESEKAIATRNIESKYKQISFNEYLQSMN